MSGKTNSRYLYEKQVMVVNFLKLKAKVWVFVCFSKNHWLWSIQKFLSFFLVVMIKMSWLRQLKRERSYLASQLERDSPSWLESRNSRQERPCGGAGSWLSVFELRKQTANRKLYQVLNPQGLPSVTHFFLWGFAFPRVHHLPTQQSIQKQACGQHFTLKLQKKHTFLSKLLD